MTASAARRDSRASMPCTRNTRPCASVSSHPRSWPIGSACADCGDPERLESLTRTGMSFMDVSASAEPGRAGPRSLARHQWNRLRGRSRDAMNASAVRPLCDHSSTSCDHSAGERRARRRGRPSGFLMLMRTYVDPYRRNRHDAVGRTLTHARVDMPEHRSD
jgi:hypothetical protein